MEGLYKFLAGVIWHPANVAAPWGYPSELSPWLEGWVLQLGCLQPLQFLIGLVCHHLPGLGGASPRNLREQVTEPRARPGERPCSSYTTGRKVEEGALGSLPCPCLLCAGQRGPNCEQNR